MNMKKLLFSFAAWHLFTFPIILLAQNNLYYYYKGEEIYLNLNREYLFIKTNNQFTGFAEDIQNELDEYTLKSFSGTTSDEDAHWAEIKFRTIPDSLEYHRISTSIKNTTGVEVVSPYVGGTEGEKVGLSNYFHVKLKRIEDRSSLYEHASMKRVTVVEQNEFMPLWFTLSCTGSTVGNSLKVCNYFYETGLFAEVDPAFMLNYSTGCVNDSSFSSLWGLKNSSDSTIDINACDAWNISTGSGVKVAVLDNGIDLNHLDLASNLSPLSYDTETRTSPSGLHGNHGTHVAGTIGAVRNNNLQVVGVAPNSKLMSVSNSFGIQHSNYPNISSNLANGINWAWQHGADVINNSWFLGHSGCGSNSSFYSALIDNAITNALNKGRNGLGTVVVFISGNIRSFNPDTCVHYPAKSNPDILVVGAITSSGRRWYGSAYGNKLDVVAPGADILSTIQNNSIARYDGTSMAAPHVSGIAALILSRNPCLKGREVRDIIEKTAQKISPYTYSNSSAHPLGRWNNKMGYGLVDAHAAVLEASETLSLDLSMRDRHNDSGYDAGYPWAGGFSDKSPDIWVRNQDDGLTNHQNQAAEYSSRSPVYVYVRVTNKGCASSMGTEKLSLYWTKAASSSSWPQNWDGTNTTIGNRIDTLNVPALQPGQDTILEFTWNVPNPRIHNKWASCLLARIEDVADDPITVHPNDLYQDIYQNNNVSMRNVAIIDIVRDWSRVFADALYYPPGSFVYVGNSRDEEASYDLILRVPENADVSPLTEEAEVSLRFDEQGWDIFESQLHDREDMRIRGEREIIIGGTNIVVSFNNLSFPANTRVPIYVGFSFLIDRGSEESEFEYHLIQKHSTARIEVEEHWTGGVHFRVKKYPREPFAANAGGDREINRGESVTIVAEQLAEAAIYNWYNSEGSLISTGESVTISPEFTHTYKLEVIALADGFKDYDEVEVTVNPNRKLTALYPNPAEDEVVVRYLVEDVSSAYLMLSGVNTNIEEITYPLEVDNTEFTINTSEYESGIYMVVLVCDNKAVDDRRLVLVIE